MSSHPDIRLISFTGSTRAGIHIAQNAAPSVKRVVQELGGKSPLIIDKGCDIEEAVQYGIDDVLINTGQTCTAYSRWLVQKDSVKEVIALAKKKAEAVIIGSGSDAFMGPMVSQAQQQRVLNYIERGIKEGAMLVTGGLEKPAGIEKGFYVRPTIFANVSNDMIIAREEIFGPVICIIEYDNIEQAIEITNDTPYGLAAAVYAKDKSLGFDIAKQIDAGMVYVNGGSYNIEAPFGGMKQSGNGREFGDEGLHEYVELKAIHVN
jgi:aldehyde dehydrogenase (NAD+)